MWGSEPFLMRLRGTMPDFVRMPPSQRDAVRGMRYIGMILERMLDGSSDAVLDGTRQLSRMFPEEPEGFGYV